MTTVEIYTYKTSGKWYDHIVYQTELKPHQEEFYNEAKGKIQPDMDRVIFERCADGHLQPLWLSKV